MAVVLAMLAIASPHEATGQSAGLVSSVVNKMEQNRQSLGPSVPISAWRNTTRSCVMQGSVAHCLTPAAGRDANVRIEWNKPHEILTVSKGVYWIYKPRLAVCYTGRSTKGRDNGLTDMINLSRKELHDRYEPLQDVREETLSGGVSTIHLKLVPIGKSNFKYAEVWVDASGMPVQTKVVEKNDDTTTVRLTNLERNVKIGADEFVVKLDSSVKVIKS